MTDDDVQRVQNRVSRLEDAIDHVLKPKLEELENTIEAKDERISDLEATVTRLESRLDSIIDVDDKSESTPENRPVALREAMVRAARDRADSGGVTWWWQEVEDQLSSHGHGGFSKPTYHTTMKDAAGKEGFRMTSKEVISGGQRREVDAIQVVPSKVTDPHLRNQLTTRDAGAATTETTSTGD